MIVSAALLIASTRGLSRNWEYTSELWWSQGDSNP
jgi:hypothetical protein